MRWHYLKKKGTAKGLVFKGKEKQKGKIRKIFYRNQKF